ncbi:MAG: hypothetical protein ABIK65_14745 [Candidatus Eisenbacteria bacterium]
MGGGRREMFRFILDRAILDPGSRERAGKFVRLGDRSRSPGILDPDTFLSGTRRRKGTMESLMPAKRVAPPSALWRCLVLAVFLGVLPGLGTAQDEGGGNASAGVGQGKAAPPWYELKDFTAETQGNKIVVAWTNPVSELFSESRAYISQDSEDPESGEVLIGEKELEGNPGAPGEKIRFEHEIDPSKTVYYWIQVYDNDNRPWISKRGSKPAKSGTEPHEVGGARPTPPHDGGFVQKPRSRLQKILTSFTDLVDSVLAGWKTILVFLLGSYSLLATYPLVRAYLDDEEKLTWNRFGDDGRGRKKNAFPPFWTSSEVLAYTKDLGGDQTEMKRLKRRLAEAEENSARTLERRLEEAREMHAEELGRVNRDYAAASDRLNGTIGTLESELERVRVELVAKEEALAEVEGKLSETLKELRRSQKDRAGLAEEKSRLESKLQAMVAGFSKALGPELSSSLDRLQLQIVPLVVGDPEGGRDGGERLEKLTVVVGSVRNLGASVDRREWTELIGKEGAGLKHLPGAIRELSEIAVQTDNKSGNLFGSGTRGSTFDFPDPSDPEFAKKVEASRFQSLTAAIVDSLGRAKRIAEAGVDISVLEQQLRKYILDEAASKFFVAEAEARMQAADLGPRLTEKIGELKAQLVNLLRKEYSLDPQEITPGQLFNDKEFRIAGSSGIEQYPTVRQNGIAEVVTWGYRQAGSDKVVQKAEVIVRS